MTHWTQRETEADEFFREDAARQGYLKEDPHAPGEGRGLWAYYADNGMVAPEKLERVIPKREVWIGYANEGEE